MFMTKASLKKEAHWIAVTKHGRSKRAAGTSCEKADVFHVCLPVIQTHHFRQLLYNRSLPVKQTDASFKHEAVTYAHWNELCKPCETFSLNVACWFIFVKDI